MEASYQHNSSFKEPKVSLYQERMLSDMIRAKMRELEEEALRCQVESLPAPLCEEAMENIEDLRIIENVLVEEGILQDDIRSTNK